MTTIIPAAPADLVTRLAGQLTSQSAGHGDTHTITVDITELGAARPALASLLGTEHRWVLWMSQNPADCPASAVHVSPTDVRDEDVLDLLDDEPSAALHAIVIDVDGLDRFDTYDRLHTVAQARKAARFVRLRTA